MGGDFGHFSICWCVSVSNSGTVDRSLREDLRIQWRTAGAENPHN